jgi:hypothetical protein
VCGLESAYGFRIHASLQRYRRFLLTELLTIFSFLLPFFLFVCFCSLSDLRTGQHNIEGRGQTSMPEAGFEPTIPATKRPRPTPQTVWPLLPPDVDVEAKYSVHIRFAVEPTKCLGKVNNINSRSSSN